MGHHITVVLSNRMFALDTIETFGLYNTKFLASPKQDDSILMAAKRSWR
jgi:hypothetical protein